MNSKNLLFVLLLPFTLLVSCKQKDEAATPLYAEHDVMVQLVQTNTTNFTTAAKSIFTDLLSDSLERAEFCQIFTHQARFMNDKSGYVFVETESGYNIAHPFHVELEGTNTLEQTDANGNFIVQKMIETIKNIGYGFLVYDYLNPTSNRAEHKTTFVGRIENSGWYSGSGFYHPNNNKLFNQTDKNKLIVKEAATFMAEGIGAVLSALTTDSLEGVEMMRSLLKHVRFFENQSGYFFVIDFKGYNVVQPPDPSIQGTYEWDIQDVKGNYLVRDLVFAARQGGGYVSYYWKDYQTNEDKLKTAFAIQIPGKDYLIGSGVYLPDGY
ncbi:MAG: cache domain-containing protein [Bacteroidales bacterium]|nr:cache domain-containing protein [Bacteroidales bacterium]